jgi:hypothetical protein
MSEVSARLTGFLTPCGLGFRVLVGCYMLVSGLARLVTGNTAASVNVFSARMYGLLLVLAALALLGTLPRRWRLHWPGRAAEIVCAALWLLIIAQAWSVSAWVSISGAFVFVAALAWEVRSHE